MHNIAMPQRSSSHSPRDLSPTLVVKSPLDAWLCFPDGNSISTHSFDQSVIDNIGAGGFIHGLLYFWLPASYSKSLIVPVSEEKLMPTLNSLRLSAAYGKAYPLSSICLRATAAVELSLNSKI